MRLLDLFSGIGGFSLSAQWVWGDDLEIVGFCEIDKYCQKVLNKNFPDVPMYEDITELDGKDFKDIDLITGGFPCQDISIAGRGAGIEGARSGLWSEMHRIISEVRPRYALIENVPMLIHRGLKRVLCDLAEIGYDAEWQIVSAKDVGAWHLRKRIWIVAYPNSRRLEGSSSEKQGTGNVVRGSRESVQDVTYTDRNRTERYESEHRTRSGVMEGCKDIPDTTEKGLEGPEPERKLSGGSERLPPKRSSEWWAVEPELGRVAHGIPSRVDRLKGLGNAIVPQCAEIIMRKIKESNE